MCDRQTEHQQWQFVYGKPEKCQKIIEFFAASVDAEPKTGLISRSRFVLLFFLWRVVWWGPKKFEKDKKSEKIVDSRTTTTWRQTCKEESAIGTLDQRESSGLCFSKLKFFLFTIFILRQFQFESSFVCKIFNVFFVKLFLFQFTLILELIHFILKLDCSLIQTIFSSIGIYLFFSHNSPKSCCCQSYK